MIYCYGVTQQGAYHVEHDLVCQDAHFYKIINEHFAIGAVADGLGSEKYTDIASKIAVEKAVAFCEEKIEENDAEEKIIDVLTNAFRVALAEIYKVADEAGNERLEYDTTLAVSVYLNGNVYYGNSGDSGIVVLNQNGTYEALTTQQRDENGYVFPLCFGEEKWVFGKKENVSSVLMATDGMLETLFPFLLRKEKVSIYVALAHYLMSEDCLHFTDAQDGEVQKKMDAFVASIGAKQVDDDKTLLVMLDTAIEPQRMSDEYYAAPDWVALKKKHDEEFRRAAYPHLYKDEAEDKAEETTTEDTIAAKETESETTEEVSEEVTETEATSEAQTTETSEDSSEVETSEISAESDDAGSQEKEGTLLGKIKEKTKAFFKK